MPGMVPDDPAQLQAQALRCRRLARSVSDEHAQTALTLLAEEYEARAAELISGKARHEVRKQAQSAVQDGSA